MGILGGFKEILGDSLKVIRRFVRVPQEAKEAFIEGFLGNSWGPSKSFEAFCGF